MKSLRGFALMEAAISVLIMGIVLTVCSMQFNSLISYMRLWTTNNNHHIIACALATYLEEKYVLPQPENQNGEYGFVPFEKLKIMEKFTYDGYGNKILYSIEGNEYPSAFFVTKSIDKDGKTICVNWYTVENFKRIFGIKEANNTLGNFGPTMQINNPTDDTQEDDIREDSIRILD